LHDGREPGYPLNIIQQIFAEGGEGLGGKGHRTMRDRILTIYPMTYHYHWLWMHRFPMRQPLNSARFMAEIQSASRVTSFQGGCMGKHVCNSIIKASLESRQERDKKSAIVLVELGM